MPLLVNTAYLPPAGYIATISDRDTVILEVMETYRKQTCRNRCTIYGPNGRLNLTIPVEKPHGNHTLTRDVLISRHEPWQRTHWRTIQTAYNNSPFFLYYRDAFEPYFHRSYHYLIDFNQELLLLIAKILRIPLQLAMTSTFSKESDVADDLRDHITGFFCGRNREVPPYTQVFAPAHGYIPGLSVIDLLFNCGPESAEMPGRISNPGAVCL